MFIRRLFYVRFRQMLWLVSEIGLFRVLFIGFLLAALLFCAYYLFFHPEYHWRGVAAVLLLVAGIQAGRRDGRFIRKLARYPEWIFWAEYMVLLLPLWIVICFTPPVYDIPLLMLGCYGISRLNVPEKRGYTFSRLLRFVPSGNFEWLGGFRRYPVIFLLYILALLFSFLPFFSLGIVWLITVCMAEFYGRGESVSLLVSGECGAVLFLKRKVKEHLSAYVLFTLPVILLYGIWNYEIWYVTVVFYIINLFCFTFFIFHKYAVYKPGESLGAGIIVSLGVLVSNLFLPLLLLSLFLMIRSYRKAIVNLNRYLYDFHS